MRNVYALRNLHPFQEKKLKCITEQDGFGGITGILTLMFRKYLSFKCMSLLTEMNPLMTMNQYMNVDCTMHNANKTKALSCVLTVNLPFSYVEAVEIMAPLLCSTSVTL
mgnify:CR=1 FL=1